MKHAHPRARVGSFIALLAVCAVAAAAQAPPGPVTPRPGAQQQRPPAKAKAEEEPQIRVRVELVSTPVTVRSSAGELVYDLSPGDFRVFDNGIEQKIDEFEMGGDPLSLVLLFQTSSRIEPFLPKLRQTGVLFTQTVLGQAGEAAVVAFHDRVEPVQEFTSDADAIEKAIHKLPGGSSGTRLHDALSYGVTLLRNRPVNRRRVMICISEAVDTGSEVTLGSVLREAQLSQITIYTVGISSTAALLRAEPRQAGPPSPFPPGTLPTPGIPGRPQTPSTDQHARGQIDILSAIILIVQMASNAIGEDALEMASAATGGLHSGAFRERAIENAIDNISGELHAQYTLTYRPAGVTPTGYHEIKVAVARPGVSVRARPGYYVAPEAGNEQKNP